MGQTPEVLRGLVDEVRGSHAALVSVLVRADGAEILVDAGADPVGERSLFEIGSVTKTITGTLLAEMVVRGETTLATRVGDVLDDAGGAAAVTLAELATHTAGLPRLAPNHAVYEDDPSDPYARFDADALQKGLADTVCEPTGEPEYSNLGFQLLGHVLSVIGGASYAELVRERVLVPVGCVDARCGDVGPGDERVPGYARAGPTPRWTQPLPGAGGVEMHIEDLGRWLAANTWPDRHPLAEAIALAQEPHWGDRSTGRGLGWRHYNGGLLHNGGTGGFRSVGVFVPEMAAVGVMANIADLEAIDGAAIRLLTRVVRGG